MSTFGNGPDVPLTLEFTGGHRPSVRTKRMDSG